MRSVAGQLSVAGSTVSFFIMQDRQEPENEASLVLNPGLLNTRVY